MMTVQQWQAKLIERAAQALAVWVETTPEDKLTWIPAVEGTAGMRSVLQQCDEIVGLNTAMAGLLRGQQQDLAAAEQSAGGLTTAAQAVAKLTETSANLAAAVRDMPDSAFTQVYYTGWAKLPGSVLLELALNNMMYHGGQMNYVQMLAGDKEFHFPEDFFTF
jgi:hypothetical protein